MECSMRAYWKQSSVHFILIPQRIIVGQFLLPHPTPSVSLTFVDRNCEDGKSYAEGDVMEFRVIRCHHSHGVFYIEGAPLAK